MSVSVNHPSIAILGARTLDPQHGVETVQDIYVADTRIVGLGQKPDGFVAVQTIDAKGLSVAPGIVDLCARLREPGFEYKATLESEMAAAAAGGVTTLVCPPDTDPVLDEPGLVNMLRQRAKSSRGPRVLPMGALTVGLKGQNITEMAVLTDAGCVAFSQADRQVEDTQVLYRAMQYAATFGYTVVLRCEDHHLTKDGVAHEGEIAARLGLPAVPPLAEVIALQRAISLAHGTGAKLHVARISTAQSVALLRAAKAQGVKVTCDVAVHHLHMTDMDIGYFDSRARVIPPFRGHADKAALRAGLADGTIDAICSDHAPVDEDEKQLPFSEAEPGVTALELMLPLTLKWAEEQNMPLAQAWARISTGPAQVLGMGMGQLALGAKADLVVFDAQAWWKVDAKALRSLGHNTPFFGLEVKGRARHTMVDGEVTFAL